MLSQSKATYDAIAGLYDSLWANWYLPAALPAIDHLFFNRVPRGSTVLDVCCGSGHVTSEIVRRGYKVTGVDASAELVRRARQRIPEAEFLIQDITSLKMQERFDAALSTFDSLNHILSTSGLEAVFLNLRQALRPGGLFVFDMNIEEAYLADLRQWHCTVHDSEVSLVRGGYDVPSRIASTEIVWFVKTERDDLWERRGATVRERCYEREEIIALLISAGFKDLKCDSAREAGVTAELGFGRLFFSATA